MYRRFRTSSCRRVCCLLPSVSIWPLRSPARDLRSWGTNLPVGAGLPIPTVAGSEERLQSPFFRKYSSYQSGSVHAHSLNKDLSMPERRQYVTHPCSHLRAKDLVAFAIRFSTPFPSYPYCTSSSSALEHKDEHQTTGDGAPPSPEASEERDAAQLTSRDHVGECSALPQCPSGSSIDSLVTSKRHDMALIFTCNVCETRSAKTMSRKTYDTGVVVVRCPGCQNLHLIADRMGWFGKPGSIEDFLADKGISVRKGSEETYEFSLEDIRGWTPAKA
ncbi:hypothetical protein CBR_g38445 [Chara braunii]|uniref:DNL-type domain-containing protein n=1 Tax=Chara braunii TaxID=69332 RepID=A0A388JNM2_CHABU|nr:hypothetical protein CBR_g38445 [Chara braunii]|eukprot:GBG59419.1 hypothetical protein CBR_g38445 [Chara braunii]